MPNHIHLTVATVVERGGKYLTVVERDNAKQVYNQPAGHVEPGEKLADAAIRETLEETGCTVRPNGIISLSTYLAPATGATYYRVCFAAELVDFNPDRELDRDIEEALWLSYEELQQRRGQLRSPLVLQAVEDYRSGRIQSLEMLHE